MSEIYIPDNELGIAEGYYDQNGIVNLLRQNADKAEVVYFIADMME